MDAELTLEELLTYTYIIVMFSGGKDSIASFLHLLEIGIPRENIILWHHDVDGREGERLFDWPVTAKYCQAFADAFDVPLYFSWKVGGFEREMLRENALTAPTKFETFDGRVAEVGGKRGKKNTRMQYPATVASLTTRWCSAYLKIDVSAAAIRNQEEFRHAKTLVITGERAQESVARANYECFEIDRSDARNGRLGRHVDHWRPVHSWSEGKVWQIIERWCVNPHPAYRLGWGRLSCLWCIFGNKNQMCSAAEIDPIAYLKHVQYEKMFGKTIHRKLSLPERVAKGEPYPSLNKKDIEAAMSTEWHEPMILDKWTLPAGAYGESDGPT